jgi:hypothetical protein
MIARVAAAGPELIREYIAANRQAGAVYIARDKAKELFAEFRQNPTVNNRHSDAAASAIADAARRTLLLEPPTLNRNWLLLVTGCPASGKTVSVGPETAERVEIQHETILKSVERTRELIKEALNAKRFPIIRLHYTDDPRINLRRMILRAMREGRTVPIRYMAETYIRVPKIVGSVAHEFGRRIAIRVVNNSESPELQVPHNNVERAIYHVNRYTEAQALEAMNGELDKLGRDHAISDDILAEARL